MRILFILLLCFRLFGEDDIKIVYPEDKQNTVSVNEGYAFEDCEKLVALDDKLSKEDKKIIIDNAKKNLQQKKYTHGGYFVFHHNGVKYLTIENFSQEDWKDEQGKIVGGKGEKRKVGIGKAYWHIKGKYEERRITIEFD